MLDMLSTYKNLLHEDKQLVQVLAKTLLLRNNKRDRIPLLLSYLDGLLQEFKPGNALERDKADWFTIDLYPCDGTTVIVANEHGESIGSMKHGECLSGLPTGWHFGTIGGSYPTHFKYLPKFPRRKEF